MNCWNWPPKQPKRSDAVFVVIALALAAAPTVADARRLVLSELKDPESARFSGVKLLRDKEGRVTGFCGYVNARNSFGGYAGKSYFIGTFERRDVVILDPELSSPGLC
jgi:hypothetical protein